MLKTFTYSVMHMSVAILVAYTLSGNWVVATSIGLVEPLVQTVFYHLHERLWRRQERQNGIALVQAIRVNDNGKNGGGRGI